MTDARPGSPSPEPAPKPPHANALPLCPAAATALLIDVDKGVRPCDDYMGNHLPWRHSVGTLALQPLRAILDGPDWQGIRGQLAAHEVPPGCQQCHLREQRLGSSQRMVLHERRSPNWHRGITYVELDSSNLCNLLCRHCNTMLSSRWIQHEARMGRPHYELSRPDGKLLLDNLRGVDLRFVDYVDLKGGEPMLNSDMLVLLQHFAELGILSNIEFNMVTNGTVVDPAILAMLTRGRKLTMTVSVDGVGDVQTYIRHGSSEIERIERVIATYAAIPNVTVTRNTAVMAYNVFSLDRIDAWWDALSARFPGRIRFVHYGLFVLWPEHLAVNVLQDRTRAALHARYLALDPVRYAPVLRALELPFAGAKLHDRFVAETQRLDRELGRFVLEAVPELAAELVRLEPEAAVVESGATSLTGSEAGPASGCSPLPSTSV